MPTRSRKTVRKYKKHKKNVPDSVVCEFCEISEGDKVYIGETKSFKLVKALFPYATWDSSKTKDHILIVPKKHTEKLADLTAPEQIEFMDIVGSYESNGYNIYARAPQSVAKTVDHQHTHLIQTDGKLHRFMFFIRKPYVRIVK